MIAPTKGVHNATNLPYSWTFSTFKWRNLRRRAMRQLKFLCWYDLQAQIRRVVIRRLVKWWQASIDSDCARFWDTALCRWTKKRQTIAVLTDKATLCAFKPFATSKSLVILSDSEVSINLKCGFFVRFTHSKQQKRCGFFCCGYALQPAGSPFTKAQYGKVAPSLRVNFAKICLCFLLARVKCVYLFVWWHKFAL